MNTSALNTTTVEDINMDAEISSLLDVNHNELNYRLLQDIKLEDVDIKLEPVSQDDSMYSQEEVEEMELQHIHLNYLKEEIEPVSVEEEPDVFPHQAQPTKCYRCGLSAAIVQRRQIVTRSIQRKLDKHSICHLAL